VFRNAVALNVVLLTSLRPDAPSTNWPAVEFAVPPDHVASSNDVTCVFLSIGRKVAKLPPFSSTTSVSASRAIPSNTRLPDSVLSNQTSINALFVSAAPDVRVSL
jgi:hypothetical protein